MLGWAWGYMTGDSYLQAASTQQIAQAYEGSVYGQLEGAPQWVINLETTLLGISAGAAVTAGVLIGVESATAIRIEVHLYHINEAGEIYAGPHLQAIQGPGWGETIWYFGFHP
jgi:hypothetical protein